MPVLVQAPHGTTGEETPAPSDLRLLLHVVNQAGVARSEPVGASRTAGDGAVSVSQRLRCHIRGGLLARV